MTSQRALERKWEMGPRKPVLVRLAEKFTVGDGCWEWSGPLTKGSGYAYSRERASMYVAHRVVYELLVGPVPEGMTLDHLCFNTKCVRPDHLDPCTMKENIARRPKKKPATHCKYGHPYGDNPVVRQGRYGPYRNCRQCTNERASRNYYAYGKEARAVRTAAQRLPSDHGGMHKVPA